jgi:hypothetical protein
MLEQIEFGLSEVNFPDQPIASPQEAESEVRIESPTAGADAGPGRPE